MTRRDIDQAAILNTELRLFFIAVARHRTADVAGAKKGVLFRADAPGGGGRNFFLTGVNRQAID